LVFVKKKLDQSELSGHFREKEVPQPCWFSYSPPDLNFLDPYFIFMYTHYNHCHRATAHLQLNLLLLLLLLLLNNGSGNFRTKFAKN